MKFDYDFGGYGEGVFTSDQISNEEYHKIKAVSAHGIMEACKSMLHFKEYVWGDEREESDTLDFGKLMHMAILEQDRFREHVVESGVSNKTLKAYKDIVKQNPGKRVLSLKESKKIQAMIDGIKSNGPVFKSLQGLQTEVTIFVIDPVTGLPLKGRIDGIGSDYLLDYKTTESANPKIFNRLSASYKYHVQAYFYLLLCRLMKMDKPYYAVIAQESSSPYICTFFQYAFATLEKGQDIVDKMLGVISDAYKNNRYLGYSDTVEELHLSEWDMGFEPNMNVSKRN